MEKLKIGYPVVVEGKFDKIRLDTVIDAYIIKTDGFGAFRNAELAGLLKKLVSECGRIILLTDSDGAGRMIRSHLRNLVPAESVIDLFIPDIPGKEKRKSNPSASGLLGVEGMNAEFLRNLFRPYADGNAPSPKGSITVTDFYEAGLTGGENSRENRKRLCRKLDLPAMISTSDLIKAVNMICTNDEFRSLAADTFTEGSKCSEN
ncbi:MAG: DUF4093 domain-containing protein [Clostridia bacterium]|nr:DUF4093 domain-containing protein [Clostridia bacterium]